MNESTRSEQGESPTFRSFPIEIQRRRTIATVLLCGLLIPAVGWALARWTAPGPNQTRDAGLRTRLNPNTATWYELAQLPGLGESAGRAIVAFRETQGRARETPVYQCPADLAAVRGIGPATIARIQSHLEFGVQTTTTTQHSRVKPNN